MTTGSRFVLPFQTVINAIGVPLPGAYLNFYISTTDTRLATFSNQALTIANPNPIQADSAGMFSNIWLQPRDYKVVLTNSDGDEIWTADPVVPFEDIDNGAGTYDWIVYMEGKPDDGEIFPVFNIVRDCYLPALLTGSAYSIDPAALPTADITIGIIKNGSQIGSITFSTTGSPSVIFTDKQAFAPGDQVWFAWPSPQDDTAANIGITLMFTVGS